MKPGAAITAALQEQKNYDSALLFQEMVNRYPHQIVVFEFGNHVTYLDEI